MRSARRNLMALAGAGAVAVILATPSPAQAKSDYRVTISGKQVTVGATVTVTVTMGDDAGLTPADRMCLFQIVGDKAPHPHSMDGYPGYAIPSGSRYVKVADCQRPAPDSRWAGSPDYYSGTTTYKLKVTSNGWLALVAFRAQNSTRVDTGGPIRSNIVLIGGPGGAKPGAAAAKTTVVSMNPAHEPATTPTTPTSPTSPTSPASRTPSATAKANFAAGPSRVKAASRPAAGRGRFVAAVVGLLLGSLITAGVMTLWPRARVKKP